MKKVNRAIGTLTNIKIIKTEIKQMEMKLKIK